MSLNIQQLHKTFNYDPETGIFIRRALQHSHVAQAGCLGRSGYRQINLKSKIWYAHQLAWAYVHGCLPNCDIDHINGDKSDNRIANLRLATRSQNMQNTGMRSSNTSGYKGVHFYKRTGQWIASIRHNGKPIHLGYFSTPEDASFAYEHKASELFGKFYRSHQAA